MTIISNVKIAPGYYRIVFGSKSLARFSFPGQFCLLTASGVFLRRPLSVFFASDAKIEFLYKVIGPGTENLSSLKKGNKVDVLGPLGTPYPLNAIKKQKFPLLIAGGTGVASLNFLMQGFNSSGIIFYGARNKAEVVPLKVNSKKGWKIHYSTEDGSKGYKGYVTGLLEKYLKESRNKQHVVYACGPNPMLRKVADICKASGIEGYISLEEMMACGVGNCQGCAVKAGDTYKMVCKDGPVFNVNDVDL